MTGPRCSSCKAVIVWGRSSTGRAVPLDPPEVTVLPGVPGKGDAWATVCTDDARVVRGLRADSGAGVEVLSVMPSAVRVVGRIAHFASCPSAGLHRRKKARPS